MRSLTALLTSVAASCAAMDQKRADIIRGPAPHGNQRETRMVSLRRRRVGAEWPRPKMVKAYIRAPMERTVTRRRIAMVAIDWLKRDQGGGHGGPPHLSNIVV